MKPVKILVITCSDEPNVKKVVSFLDSEVVFRLNTDILLAEGSFSCLLGENTNDWEFRTSAGIVRSCDVASIWYRRPATPKSPTGLPATYQGFVENESQKFLKALWSTVGRKVFWMNHPSVLRELEYNKLYQSQIAARVGLRTPETLVTNDQKKAEQFLDRWRDEVVVKVFGGSSVSDVKGRHVSVYTNRVSREFLKSFGSEIAYAPVMFQNYIPKKFELRITAVHEQFFACEIHSQDSPKTKDDWRHYDFERVGHCVHELPNEMENKLRLFMRETRLAFGAIDMIVTPEGEYLFIEVNPSGQWGWTERLTGMPISRTIAETLANPPKG